MLSLKGTKTAENLLKSFAGESQARSRYTYYSSIAKKEGYIQIANIFLEAAENEKEHAKKFYKFLKNDLQDQTLEITATYPISLHQDTLSNLLAAANGEKEEWTTDYPAFAKIAKEEGFIDIAIAYEKIAEVEKAHEKRYRKLLENIKNGTLFKKDVSVLWKCTNCGYIYEGYEAPNLCPACQHPQGYFEVFIENY